jgi:RNA polymerase sigma-70 factor (ECF subfamily)
VVDLTQDRPALDGYRRGDREVLTRLFEAHGPDVARWVGGGFSFKSGDGRQRFDGFRSAVDVHDVVHEVFRRAFEPRAREAYSGLTPFPGYLFVITRNVVLRRLDKGRREEGLDDASLEALVSDHDSPEERVMRDDEVRMVREFLATLTEDERRFAELRFTEQRAQADVGGALGWTRKKVRLAEESIRERLVRFMLRRRGTRELGHAEGAR